MEEKPYKFEDPSSKRIASNIVPSQSVMPVAGLIFTASIYMYSRKIFRIDKNAMNLLLFSGASALASYSYASYFMSSPILEAGLLNNQKETN